METITLNAPDTGEEIELYILEQTCINGANYLLATEEETEDSEAWILKEIRTEENDLIYEFECSDYQAESYFFKFGENVKILEPQTLADKFKQKYETAAACYQVEN